MFCTRFPAFQSHRATDTSEATPQNDALGPGRVGRQKPCWAFSVGRGLTQEIGGGDGGPRAEAATAGCLESAKLEELQKTVASSWVLQDRGHGPEVAWKLPVSHGHSPEVHAPPRLPVAAAGDMMAAPPCLPDLPLPARL